MDLLRGPAHGQRPPGSPPVWPGCSRTSTRASRRCGATCRARAAGTATACRSSSRSRRSWGSTRSTRSRPTASPSSTRACRESVLAATWRTGRRSPRASGVDRHQGRVLDARNDYIESVWWLVRQMWDAGLIYEGHRVSPYCARCGTARCRRHEVAQGYRDVVDPSVYVRFPITDGGRRAEAPICSCGRPRRGRSSRTSRGGRPRYRLRAGAGALRRPARPHDGRGAPPAPVPATGADVVGPHRPRPRQAAATSARSTSCRSTTAASASSPPTS